MFYQRIINWFRGKRVIRSNPRYYYCDYKVFDIVNGSHRIYEIYFSDYRMRPVYYGIFDTIEFPNHDISSLKDFLDASRRYYRIRLSDDYSIRLPQIEYQDWFCQNYPDYVSVVLGDIKDKYSQVEFGNKFGLFSND